MARRTFDRSPAKLIRHNPPELGSRWMHPRTPRIVITVVRIQGPQWAPMVRWRRADGRGDGVTTVQAFFRTFLSADAAQNGEKT